jgi:hypothetical protein
VKKLYDILLTIPNALGGWALNGKEFIIRDVEEFTKEIISKVFKHNNYRSFLRQLNACTHTIYKFQELYFKF